MDTYQQYDYQQYEEPKRKKGGFWGKFIALLLGFILGIVATVGSVVGVGYYAYTKVKLKDAADKVASLTGANFDYTKYITEEYAEKTLAEAVGSLTKLVSESDSGKTLSLDSFSEVTPYTATLAENIQKILADYGLDIDKDEFAATPFTSMAKYFTDKVLDLRLGALLSKSGVTMNDLLTYICYGEEGVDYEIVDGKIEMYEGHEECRLKDFTQGDGVMGVLYNVPLDVILNLDLNGSTEVDPVMKALAFGSEGVHYKIVNVDGKLRADMQEMRYTATHDLTSSPAKHTLFNELGKEISGAVYDETTGAFAIPQSDGSFWYAVHDATLPDGEYRVYDTIEGTPTPLKFKKRTVNDLTSNASEIISTLRIKDMMTIDSSSSTLLIAIQNWTIDDLKDQETLESLKIGQILQIDSTSASIMQALKDKTLADLKNQDTIDDLLIKDVMTINESSSALMKAIQDWKLSDLSNPAKIDSLKIGEILEIGSDSSKIMQALSEKTLGEMKQQSTIESLKIGEILEVDSGSSKIMQALQDKTLAEMKQQSTIENLKIGEILNVDPSSSSLLQAIQDWTIGDLNDQDKINTLPLNAVIQTDSSSPTMLTALLTMPNGEATTLGDLSSRINTLTLGEVLDGADSNDILKKLKDTPVVNLADELNTLSIQELYTNKIFDGQTVGGAFCYKKQGETTYTVAESNLYFHLYEKTANDWHFQFYDVSDSGKTPETFDPTAAYADAYKVTLCLKGEWKYLLTNADESNSTDHAYMISDMDKLVTNMTESVKAASLNDLNGDFDMGLTAGFLETTLKNAVIDKANESAEQISPSKKGQTMGELTVKELTVYIETVLNNPSLLFP